MKHPSAILKRMRLTEKATSASATLGQYTFEVFKDATKGAIRSAVEATFKVRVTRVNIQNYMGKHRRGRNGPAGMTSDYKKALVTLKIGDKIELV